MTAGKAVNTTVTVRLVDRRRRIVEVDGPRPPEWRRPKLSLDSYVVNGQLPEEVAFCFKSGRTSRFLVDPGQPAIGCWPGLTSRRPRPNPMEKAGWSGREGRLR